MDNYGNIRKTCSHKLHIVSFGFYTLLNFQGSVGIFAQNASHMKEMSFSFHVGCNTGTVTVGSGLEIGFRNVLKKEHPFEDKLDDQGGLSFICKVKGLSRNFNTTMLYMYMVTVRTLQRITRGKMARTALHQTSQSLARLIS